jgi:hypothetical protein
MTLGKRLLSPSVALETIDRDQIRAYYEYFARDGRPRAHSKCRNSRICDLETARAIINTIELPAPAGPVAESTELSEQRFAPLIYFSAMICFVNAQLESDPMTCRCQYLPWLAMSVSKHENSSLALLLFLPFNCCLVE